MNSTNRKTLENIFRHPPSKTLEWARIEALLLAIGCIRTEGRGSRVRFEKDGITVFFHRPHPGKDAKPYQVLTARDFLIELEVTP